MQQVNPEPAKSLHQFITIWKPIRPEVHGMRDWHFCDRLCAKIVIHWCKLPMHVRAIGKQFLSGSGSEIRDWKQFRSIQCRSKFLPALSP